MSKASASNNKLKKTDDVPSRHPVFPFVDGDRSIAGEPEILDADKMFIECPGATVYEPGTRNVVAGVHFFDDSDPSAGYEIIDHAVFAPEHRRRRIIKKEHAHSIRRCQACQDLTVRLMRREGPDFFIPNPRFPRKKRLKPVEKNW
ncbi:hypothetical protein TRIP_C90205 [Candidatus Zixiibacteriota bacterium]|nr:hypothetical protein TRIP_C90205 [candidate division Zixibacteria bacterium]